MIGKNTNYIITLTDQTIASNSLIGGQARKVIDLLKAEVPLQKSFVVSTLAFDDFLIATGLAHDLNTIITEFDGTEAEATRISELITSRILKVEIPQILADPLLHAYKNLGGFTDSSVSVQLSHNMDELEIVGEPIINVFGENQLFYAIKKAWTQIFTPDIILEKYLNKSRHTWHTALIVSQQSLPEISGSIDIPATRPELGDKNSYVEVSAILGAKDDDINLVTDNYLVELDAEQAEIREKHVSQQEYMFLWRHDRSQHQLVETKVDISRQWQRQQKLSDKFIKELAIAARDIYRQYQQPLNIGWVFAAGKLAIQTIMVDDYPEIDSVHYDLTDKVFTNHLNIEAEPKPQPNFDTLVEEVEEMSAGIKSYQEVAESYEDIENMNLAINLFLDISNLENSKMHMAAKFSGAFVDGTKTVIRGGTLPEQAGSKAELNDITQDYALEFDMVAKLVDQKMMIYKLSTLQASNVNSDWDEANQLGISFGTDRLLKNPEAISTEIGALKRAKYGMALKKLAVVVPDSISASRFMHLKKQIGAAGFTRSATSELWLEINTVATLVSLKNISRHDIDGLFINLPGLARHVTGESEISTESLEITIDLLEQHLVDYHWKLNLLSPTDPIILDAISNSNIRIDKWIVSDIPEVDFLNKISKSEGNGITNLRNNGAGRPAKSLF